jgi:hypothetical protein
MLPTQAGINRNLGPIGRAKGKLFLAETQSAEFRWTRSLIGLDKIGSADNVVLSQ